MLTALKLRAFTDGVSVLRRNKQMMGLGSLFGEGDLQQLDGDPVKERQVVDRQVTALWEILWVWGCHKYKHVQKCADQFGFSFRSTHTSSHFQMIKPNLVSRSDTPVDKSNIGLLSTCGCYHVVSIKLHTLNQAAPPSGSIKYLLQSDRRSSPELS